MSDTADNNKKMPVKQRVSSTLVRTLLMSIWQAMLMIGYFYASKSSGENAYEKMIEMSYWNRREEENDI